MKHWSYGRHVIEAAIKHKPNSIKKIYLSADNKLRSNSDIGKFVVETWPVHKFHKSFPKLSHQCAVIEFKFWPTYDYKQFLKEMAQPGTNKLVLILDRIHSPFNFGGIIRSAKACGAEAVILSKNKQTGINSVVAHVSAGTVFSSKIIFVENLARVIQKLKKINFWIVAATHTAKKFYNESNFQNLNIALVAGNEGDGIRPLLLKHADLPYKVPMNSTESLNVGVAVALIMYEIRNQQNFWNRN